MLVPGSCDGGVGLPNEEQGVKAGAGWKGSIYGGDGADMDVSEPLGSQNGPKTPGNPPSDAVDDAVLGQMRRGPGHRQGGCEAGSGRHTERNFGRGLKRVIGERLVQSSAV